MAAQVQQAEERVGALEAGLAYDRAALQRQVEELTGQVRDLKVQRVSTNREIKLQRAWVENFERKNQEALQIQQQVTGEMRVRSAAYAAVDENREYIKRVDERATGRM